MSISQVRRRILICFILQEVFHERVKTFQTWQHAQATLAKKRENKAKMELTGRMDKVEQANEEVKEVNFKN